MHRLCFRFFSSINAYSIYNNNILHNQIGLIVYNSSNNCVHNNSVLNNNISDVENMLTGFGIALFQTANNNIIEDNIVNKNLYGILCLESNNNKIDNNSFCFNIGINETQGGDLPSSGIILSSNSNDNLVSNNIACNNYFGVISQYSKNNNITNCFIELNGFFNKSLKYSIYFKNKWLEKAIYRHIQLLL